ncbi:unnamed protein product [Brachionus calyciflorus]|uniref:RFX-type winged-helix domain-containing protein n=1 Tax=Brachionus calyciflorus TaxID=104777 RepID=A0A813XWM3_9BILA|nr:unnamed protein product [Brachionus calyciflorus]
MVATIVAKTTSITTTTNNYTETTLFEPKTIINLNNYKSSTTLTTATSSSSSSSLPSSSLTTISNTTENNKMSCSIDDSNQNASLLIQSSQLDKAQGSLSNTSTSSSSTPSSSNSNQIPNSPTSNLISLVTPLQTQNYQKINQNNSQQPPTKIVQAGSHYILTTVFQGNTGQKVVSVNPTSNQNGQTLSILNSQNMASSSSVGSSSSNNNSIQNSQQSLNEPTTTTITLTSPNPQSLQNGNQPTILFPLQSAQYTNYVDTSQNQNTQSVSLFSPLNSNSQYYTFQSTPNFVQQTNIITNQQNQNNQSLASPTRLLIQQDHQQQNQSQNQQSQQQQQQQQQAQNTQVYMFSDNNQTLNDLENSAIEFEGHAAHTAQAAPITVQWLIDNFEPAEGCSLRRSTLYNYYIHHCNEQKIEPVNPASFGKLIRSVFLGLRTRRLGTRGNSKYHYYGIRVKINSLLNQLSEDHTMAIRNHPMSLSPTGSPQQPQSPILNQSTNHHHGPTPKRAKNSNYNNQNFEGQNQGSEYKPIITTVIDHNNHNNNQNQPLMTVVLSNGNTMPKTIPQTTQIAKSNGHKNNVNDMINKNYTIQDTHVQQQQQQQQQQQHQQQLQEPIVKQTQSNQDLDQLNLNETTQLPNFGHIQTDQIQNLPLPLQDFKKFEDLYKHHCERILESVISFKLEGIRDVWLSFWRGGSPINQLQNFYEEQLSTHKLYILCDIPKVIEYIRNADYLFYQFCIEILIPDVLSSLPHSLVQNIRGLSKSVDTWLRQALCNCPDKMRQSKLVIINTFSMTLRRYTSLNHLAQTVKNSLQNETILAQMLNDINRVDFNYIREQAKWTCGCDERVLIRLENEFKDSLRNHSQWSLEGWISWLDNTANTLLQEYEGTDKYSKMARQFLLKWSFMCSSIVRDLTLRSAPTFGSFHLIRLLYDEYMCYWIEHKIANELKQPPLAIMCNFDC